MPRFAGALAGRVMILAVISVIAASCANGSPSVGCRGGPLKVVVTLPVFADFACEVGGERVTVTSLIPLGADPHTYQPPPEETRTIQEAQLILYNGLGVDQPAVDFMFKRARGSAQIISFAVALPSPTAEQPPPDQVPITAQEAGDNPHMWLDVQQAMTYIASTGDSLEIVDPEGIPTYRQNSLEYVAELEALDSEIQRELDSIPEERRKLVVFHDSLPHFASRYGLDLLGFATAIPSREPTSARLNDLAQQIRDEAVPSVFAEVGFDASSMESLAEETGARLCSLYSDILDEEAHTYIESMRASAEELTSCLGEPEG